MIRFFPFLLINSYICPLLLPFYEQTDRPAIITASRMMSYFFTCYKLADRRNEKDTVVCDLHRKHY